MKKMCVFIAVALLLMSAMALAEGGVNVEVIRVDGVSVVVLTPEASLQSARRLMSAEMQPDFVLPELLTVIEDSAFEGIAAGNVEVTANVAAIGARAFADCASLTAITIPATVVKIDDTAFEGCAGVTVYGAAGSEAERVAALYGFDFVDPNAEPEVSDDISAESFLPAAVVLPPVPLN
ncbi:MAG: leucine-rich repeat protein [bacterium]